MTKKFVLLRRTKTSLRRLQCPLQFGCLFKAGFQCLLSDMPCRDGYIQMPYRTFLVLRRLADRPFPTAACGGLKPPPARRLRRAHLHLLCNFVAQLTLTTMALNQCSSRWFEACSCKPASRAITPHLLCSLVAHLPIERE